MPRGARTKKIRIRQYVVIGVLGGLLFIFGAGVIDIFKKEEAARTAAARTQKELEVIQERTKNLSHDLEVNHSERGTEAALRQMYGVARPGEEVIIVVPTNESEEKGFISWWRKVLGWFGL